MSSEQLHDSLAPLKQAQDWYAHTIWGKQIDCDDVLFEVMSLQVFQAGLTWRMILQKRDGFRAAFDSWNIEKVASFRDNEVKQLQNDPRIIRNLRKIQATIENACIILDLQIKHGTFCNWFYNILEGAEYPSLQKTLKKTFKFMGPEIARMWLLATGRISAEEGERYKP